MAGIMERPNITIREEANAITVWAFRNGYIEQLHAQKAAITDPEMKRLDIDISSKLADILTMRDTNTAEYWKNIAFFLQYCQNWEK